jgi:hypothetical protein
MLSMPTDFTGVKSGGEPSSDAARGCGAWRLRPRCGRRKEPQTSLFVAGQRPWGGFNRATADTETRDKLLKYGSGSQWQVDPSTAAALVLVGAAVKLPSPAEAPPVPGIGGMSMISAESA